VSADWIVCEVYWGSHGCRLERGHQGPHLCECCRCTVHRAGLCCVGAPPYYGPDTRFYGDDARRLGLPLVAP